MDLGACVRLQGFHLGNALDDDDSVPILEGLGGIAVGCCGILSRDGKARDHRSHRIKISDGGTPRRRRVDAGVGRGGRSLRTASARIVVANTILTW